MNTSATTTAVRTPPMPRNGVDTPKLFATIGAVADQPSLARFRFGVQSRWISGTHSRSTMHGFHGVGSDMQHNTAFQAAGDHPPVLCGEDQGPTPVEWVLHGLACCLTAGIANIAAARGVDLTHVACSVEGDIDLQGVLGLSAEVRNGFQAIRVAFTVESDAPAEKVAQIVMQAQARSAVLDMLTNGVPVAVTVNGCA